MVISDTFDGFLQVVEVQNEPRVCDKNTNNTRAH